MLKDHLNRWSFLLSIYPINQYSNDNINLINLTKSGSTTRLAGTIIYHL